MPGGGYNLLDQQLHLYRMRLARYELMLNVWRAEGNYVFASH